MTGVRCVLLIAICLTGCIHSAQVRALNSAVEAMGGKDKILAVKTLSKEGEGEDGNLGQNFTPESPLTKWKVTGFRQTSDFENKRMRIEQMRIPEFPFAMDTSMMQSTSVDGDIAWNKTGEQVSSRMSDRVARDRQADLLHNPIALMRAALSPQAQLSKSREEGDRQLIDIATTSGTLTLAIDKNTHLPASITSITDQPNLGDVVIETTFSEYQDVDGLKLPMHLVTKLDKWTQSDIRVARYVLNPNVGNLAAPGPLKAETAPPNVPSVVVTSELVAPGIWVLGGGGNYHSIALEFADHLTLFELPESEANAKGVLEKTHSLKFGKPLTEVIISHHHFDHAAGLRLAAASGLTIITARANIPYFKDLLARKHTVVPDQFAAGLGAQKTQFKPVDDQLVLKDGVMEVDLYHVKDNSHTDTLLMGWVPAQHALIQADLFDSGWVRQPWADNLLKNVELRGLKPEKDVPVHGKAEPWTEVLATLKAKK
jgi:glyoxylase-like metal-dependent hydrolase (beta-lactamase superfamily II)